MECLLEPYEGGDPASSGAWTSGLQNCERVMCVSLQVCSHLLEQRQEAVPSQWGRPSAEC